MPTWAIIDSGSFAAGELAAGKSINISPGAHIFIMGHGGSAAAAINDSATLGGLPVSRAEGLFGFHAAYVGFRVLPPTGAVTVQHNEAGMGTGYWATFSGIYNPGTPVRATGTINDAGGLMTLVVNSNLDDLIFAGYTKNENNNDALTASGGPGNTGSGGYRTGTAVSTSMAFAQTGTLSTTGTAVGASFIPGTPPSPSGNWWYFTNQWRDFLRDLKRGLLIPEQLRGRYGQLMGI